MDASENSGKSRAAGLVLANIALLLLVTVNLPYQFVASGHTSDVVNPSLMMYGPALDQNYLPKMAGWPLRYFIQYEIDGHRETHYWSTMRLLVNVAIALIVACSIHLLTQLRLRSMVRIGNRKLDQVFWDVSLALAILVVPGLIVGWNYRTASQHYRIAASISKSGVCKLSSWIPRPLADQLPAGLVQLFVRIRSITLLRPDALLVERAAAVPTLIEFRCLGGDFDASALQNLAHCHHLTSLQISHRAMDDADVRLIASLVRLKNLNLSRTDLHADQLHQFGPLPLVRVDLTMTPLKLSSLGRPQWSASVEELRLPSPPIGQHGSLVLEDWPRLQRLSFEGRRDDMNDAPLEIRLSNLPQLETLELRRSQNHRLYVDDAPRLSDLRINDGPVHYWDHRSQFHVVPGLPWFSELELHRVPSLMTLSCFVRDLELLRIDHAPNLRELRLGAYLFTSYRRRSKQSMPPKRIQDFIDSLGDHGCATSLGLHSISLQAIDISPLAKNGRIRHLHLINTDVTPQQVLSLQGMSQLETLNAGDCQLESDQLATVLERFPALRELNVDGSELTRIELVGRYKLQTIRSMVLRRVDHVRIVDQPLLNCDLRVENALSHLEIRGAQSLQGLVVDVPWPSNATLTGLRDLKWFAAGGDEVDDEVLDELLGCGSLSHLVLAYPSISRSRLNEIGKLEQLSTLALPGADVDDEVTSHWKSLTSLYELNLDDTRVSVKTLAWLSRIGSLRRLSLNRVPLDEAAMNLLAEFRQINELQLSGDSLDLLPLRPLLASHTLDKLELSDCKLNQTVIDALAESPSLRYVNLINCDVPDGALSRLKKSNSTLVVQESLQPDAEDEKFAGSTPESTHPEFVGERPPIVDGRESNHEFAQDSRSRTRRFLLGPASIDNEMFDFAMPSVGSLSHAIDLASFRKNRLQSNDTTVP